MARGHRIIFLLALTLALAAAACGGNKKDVQRARTSLYDTDFVVVYNAALQVTKDLYPMLKDSPGPGRISTAWHSIRYGNNQDDLQNQRTLAQSQGFTGAANTPQATMTGMPTRLAYKRYFIRFDVSVVGGRPWRVKVTGHASEWDPGAAMPTELTGAARPPWLDARTESLQVAIYKRIRQFAVPMKEEAPPAEEPMPKTDPKSFANVPAGAATALAAVKDAVAKRDYVALRPQLDDNITWSLGGGTGADIAIATWQADPSVVESMSAAMAAGCAAETPTRVTCPAGAPKPGVYQLVLENKGGTWKVSSFVRAE